jgi:hypothetical protein
MPRSRLGNQSVPLTNHSLLPQKLEQAPLTATGERQGPKSMHVPHLRYRHMADVRGMPL